MIVDPAEVEIDEIPDEIVDDVDLDRIDDDHAAWVYDPQYEAAVDVDASVDPRPCITCIVDSRWGPARLTPDAVSGPDGGDSTLRVPSPQHRQDRLLRRPDRRLIGLVDARPLPTLDDPVGRDPVTGRQLVLRGVAYSVTPWSSHTCVECGHAVEELSGLRCPAGWRHPECDPSTWDDADLSSFAGGGGGGGGP